MKKRSDNKKGKALFIAGNLIISILAFSFLISLASVGFSSLSSASPLATQNPPKIDIKSLATAPKTIAKSYTVSKDLFAAPVSGGEAIKVPTGTVFNSAGADGSLSATVGGKEVILNPELAKSALDSGQIAVTAPAKSTNLLSSFFGVEAGTGMDAILTGLQWGVVAAGIGYLIGTLFGMDPKNTKALSLAMGGGAFVWQALATYIPEGATAPLLTPLASFGVGLGVAAAIFIFMYKKISTKTVKFECKPYEPPTGGSYCELCNKDKFRPCSEYRCRSLGQACQLLNAGTGKEACAWVNPNDVNSPTISPWTDVLLKGYSYKDVKIRPPGTGMRVVRDSASDGCVKAFTPLIFGIQTNEPSQCKIDYNHTVNVRDVKNAYSSMAYYFGESNIYEYNHSQTLRLPGPAALAAQNISPEISNDGTYTLYVRCQDANGNVNEDEFAVRFCVEKGPDTTPPRIEGTSIPNGMPVAFNTNDTDIEVYVNEPATCKWSKQDKEYDQMENDMACNENVWEINTNMLYKCFGKLTGLENRKDNIFYFKCRDQPWADLNDRNTNQESYALTIKGSQPLNIKANSIKPNGTIQGFADVISVDLYLETENGYNKGEAMCFYSTSTLDSSYIKMYDTGTNKHKQNQQLAPGAYTYYFKCVDLGGNADYGNTTFNIEVDRSAPKVTRVYNEGSNLKVETDEKSTCYYSININNKCNFAISEGKAMLYQNATGHYTDWKTDANYYVKCADSSGNQPNPTDCSIIIRPYNIK